MPFPGSTSALPPIVSEGKLRRRLCPDDVTKVRNVPFAVFASKRCQLCGPTTASCSSKLYRFILGDFTAAPSSLKFAGSPKATARSIQHAPCSSSATRSAKEHSRSHVGAQQISVAPRSSVDNSSGIATICGTVDAVRQFGACLNQTLVLNSRGRLQKR
jgi:hypothetical protein